jgi:hypothetical protein
MHKPLHITVSIGLLMQMCRPISMFTGIIWLRIWRTLVSTRNKKLVKSNLILGGNYLTNSKNILNSMALVHKGTIPTERPPRVDEVSSNFLRIEGVAWSAQRIHAAVDLGFLDPEPLLFHSSSSSVILTKLSGPPSRLTSQKIC